MAVTLALVAAAIKGVNKVQDWADGTTAVNKYNESLEKSEPVSYTHLTLPTKLEV